MAKTHERKGKGGSRKQQMMKIYKPGLAISGFQSVPVDDWELYRDSGWKIAPTFREVETACVICGSDENLITIGALESWTNFPYADLIASDHICEMCVADLSMPKPLPPRLTNRGDVRK